MRNLTLNLLLILSLLLALPAAADSDIKARDFAADADEASRRSVPILVMFMSDYCPYCETVMEDYIEPMSTDPAYAELAIIRVVDVDSSKSILDFAGDETDHADFAGDHGVTLVPVIKLLDADGEELVPELLGFSSEHFYGYYLETRLRESLAKLRGENPASVAPTAALQRYGDG